jgi:hypothetical protein
VNFATLQKTAILILSDSVLFVSLLGLKLYGHDYLKF